MSSSPTLRDYQEEDLQRMLSVARIFEFSEQRTGKTPKLIRAMSERFNRGEIDRGIIVVPKGLLYQWLSEWYVWSTCNARIRIVKTRKDFQFPGRGEVLLMNAARFPDSYIRPPHKSKYKPSDQSEPAKLDRAALKVQRRQYKADLKYYSDLGRLMVVIDEAHKFKSPKSRYTRMLQFVCDVAKYVIPATGTPYEKSPMDLWHLSRLAGLGDIWGSWPHFRKLFGAYKTPFGDSFRGPTEKARDVLAPHMIRRRRKVVLPHLPKFHVEYVTARTRWDTEMEDVLKKQIAILEAGGQPDFTQYSAVRMAIANARMEAASDIAESYESSGTPLLVFCSHKEPVIELGKREGWVHITGETSAQRRNEIQTRQHEYRGIAMSTRAGNVGMTLDRFEDVLFIDLEPIPGANCQARDRIIGRNTRAHQIIMTSGFETDRKFAELIFTRTVDARILLGD